MRILNMMRRHVQITDRSTGLDAQVEGPRPNDARIILDLPMPRHGESIALNVGGKSYTISPKGGRGRLAFDVPQSCRIVRV